MQPNKALLRTPHKVRRPENADVGAIKNMGRFIIILAMAMTGCARQPLYPSAPDAIPPAPGQELALSGTYYQGMGWGSLELILHENGRYEAIYDHGDINMKSSVSGTWQRIESVLSLHADPSETPKFPIIPNCYEILIYQDSPIFLNEFHRSRFRTDGVTPYSCLRKYDNEKTKQLQQGGPAYPPQGVGSADP